MFINLYCVKYGAIALQEIFDSIQPKYDLCVPAHCMCLCSAAQMCPQIAPAPFVEDNSGSSAVLLLVLFGYFFLLVLWCRAVM